MESKKTFGAYVKARRVETGLTQKEFADTLYVTESAVSKWERGLSYPDITLITEICRVLNISEHELLTASEDINARNQERLARRYLTLIRRFKITQYFLYGIALLTCFIVNIAVSGKLSWFFIVLAAEAVGASLTLLPILAVKKRGLITLAGFTASLISLLAICCIYTGGDWFFVAAISVVFGLSILFAPFILRNLWLPAPFGKHKALINFATNTILLFALLLIVDIYTGGGRFLTTSLPIAAFCLILPWGYMLIIAYTKINRFLKTSACLWLSCGWQFAMRGFIDMILGEPYKYGLDFDFAKFGDVEYLNGNVDAVIFFGLLGTAIGFGVVGVVRGVSRAKGTADTAE
ncbi:MAG: helix-turn-helix domain-containing protein [Oscillospiraceae bacterium]|nr:helix-turn-helix domain-containing protein [Oscillospiraceae bacterium]